MNMSQKFRLVFAVVPVALILGTTAQADTNVGGTITADTHWTEGSGPYVATQSIIVVNGATLTIDPGVEVRFDPNKALAIVSGQLIARGTEAKPICFTSNGGSGKRWGYISFGDESIDASFDGSGNYVSGSILEHTIVEYAGDTDIRGAIHAENASPYVTRSTIRNNDKGGIYALKAHNVRIEGNYIYGNSIDDDGGGIWLQASVDPVISGNDIRENTATADGGALWLRTSPGLSLLDNTIIGNVAGRWGGGLLLTSNDNSLISGNTISENIAQSSGGGIRSEFSQNIEFSVNTISQNIANGSGGGMSVSGSNIAFSGNSIVGNYAGGDGAGIYLYGYHMTFSGDVISDNQGEGIYLFDNQGVGDIVVSVNTDTPTHIYGNEDYQIYNQANFQSSYDPNGPGNIDARNVFWGTYNEYEIMSGIFDFFDDAGRGIVFYDPWAILELLPGDTNNDGVVSADDYGSVQLNFGDIGVAGIPGDANGDGVVSADDYGSVQLNFGAMAGLGGALVPEPATLLLLCIGGLAILRRRRFDGVHHGRKESTNYTDLRRLHR